jgi:large subunit ribosomal protein L10e
MRGAYGKPIGTVARVNVNQILVSIRAKPMHEKACIDALKRAGDKFPGNHRVVVSKKWGFTKYERAEYEKLRAEGKLIPDGSTVKVFNTHVKLD